MVGSSGSATAVPVVPHKENSSWIEDGGGWEGRESRGQNTECRRQHEGDGAGDRQKVSRVAAVTTAFGVGGGFGCRAAVTIVGPALLTTHGDQPRRVLKS